MFPCEPVSSEWFASGKSQSLLRASVSPLVKWEVRPEQILKVWSQVGTLSLTRERQKGAQTCCVGILAGDFGVLTMSHVPTPLGTSAAPGP